MYISRTTSPVLVPREADAKPARALVEADVDERSAEPAVLPLNLPRGVAVVVLLLAVVAAPRHEGGRVAVDGDIVGEGHGAGQVGRTFGVVVGSLLLLLFLVPRRKRAFLALELV